MFKSYLFWNGMFPLIMLFLLQETSSQAPESSEASSNSSSPEARIIGGYPIEITQAPYQVALAVQKLGTYYAQFCGGALLKKDLVLTAAHCLYEMPLDKIMVFAGSKYIQLMSKSSPIKFTILHENYQAGYFDDDIALVKLSKPFQLSNSIQTISLVNQWLYAGTWCSIAGWGNTQPDVPQTPSQDGPLDQSQKPRLMQMWIPIYKSLDCQKIYPNYFNKGHLCAGYEEGNRATCFGDFGGPLVCRKYLTGIASFGGEECQTPTVFTDVYFYRHWVARNSVKERADSSDANAIHSFDVLIISIVLYCMSFVLG